MKTIKKNKSKSLQEIESKSRLTGFSKQETKDKKYISPIYLEQQLFGSEDTSNYQMKGDSSPIINYGLDLSVNQRKALAAVQILFAQTDYKGNSIIEEIGVRTRYAQIRT